MQSARLHPMEPAARLRAGYAHPVLHRLPSLPPRHPLARSSSLPSSLSHSLALSRSLARSLSLVPLLPLFPSRAGLFSVCVPGVCTHPVQWHSGGLHSVRPPCPTLLFAGSGPRENSYVVPSYRVTPSRDRRSSSPAAAASRRVFRNLVFLNCARGHRLARQ